MQLAFAERMSGVRCVMLNAKRLNFDGKLDLSRLEDVAQVEAYDASVDDASILERVQDAEVVITKEMTLSGDVISRFPASVKLVVEAGTGYNNVDREALAAKSIQLRNCPAYSTEAVATLVITHVLALSSSMYAQQRKLQCGDKRHFEDMDGNIGAMPHFELRGKTLGLIAGNGAIGSQVAAGAARGCRTVSHFREALSLSLLRVSLRCPHTLGGVHLRAPEVYPRVSPRGVSPPLLLGRAHLSSRTLCC